MRRFGPQPQANREDRTRVNRMIRVPEVLVIGAEGEQIGVMQTREALRRAEDEGLDLVEVAPNARPPVCRLMDYGRYKYEQQKKDRQKVKSHGGEQKELRMKPSIEPNDYQTKIRHAQEFLAEGNRVKLTVRFRGRELAHRELGRELLEKLVADLVSSGKMEGRILDEGRNMSVNVVPTRTGGAAPTTGTTSAEAPKA